MHSAQVCLSNILLLLLLLVLFFLYLSTYIHVFEIFFSDDGKPIGVSDKEYNKNVVQNRRNVDVANEEDMSGEEGSESEKSNTGKDFEMVQHNEIEDK